MRSTASERPSSVAVARGSSLRPLVEVAAAAVARADLRASAAPPPADVLGERAAVDEHAAGQVLAERRQEARDRVEPAAVLAHAAARDAAEQPDRVRVARVVEDRLDRPLLDELAGVEDADPLAHLADHAEVVADEEHRRVEARCLQRRDQVEHLGLDGRVEAGRRLVEDQQRRVLRQRHRDHDALLHAARELVRVAAHAPSRVGDVDLARAPRSARSRASPRDDAASVNDLGDLAADADRRIQRRAGVLVDHRDRVVRGIRRSSLPRSASTSSPATWIEPARTRPLRGR